jgi:dienelactone hydrolase
MAKAVIYKIQTMIRKQKSQAGTYGFWMADLVKGLPLLSFRRKEFRSLSAWRRKAAAKVLELLAQPYTGNTPKAKIHKKHLHDGLYIEELSWQLPYGPRTQAFFMKPAHAKKRLPGILGLHDHAAKKHFGKRKITRLPGKQHPMMRDHQKEYYGGRAWANEIAKRGYAVLVHDCFLFASRRVRYKDINTNEILRGLKQNNSENSREILKYNEWSAEHEHIMAKSFMCSRTTWPGTFVSEDQRALDYLCSRKDVDARRIGCMGLSGGGLRTNYLAGIDRRIRAAVPVGFMSSWRDFLLKTSYMHSWMTYIPAGFKHEAGSALHPQGNERGG